MQKHRFKKLALIGLASGLLCSSQAKAENAPSSKAPSSDNPEVGNLGYHLMTEDEILIELNPKGIKLFQSLDQEGKSTALKVASARCQGTNECAGLNACKTDSHDCAGKGTCKNTSKCALADKNLAVKLAADYMAKKRAKAIGK